MEQVNRVSPSSNRWNPSEKYIEVVTVDGYEFTFMGFIAYDKALKTLRPHSDIATIPLKCECSTLYMDVKKKYIHTRTPMYLIVL